MSKASSVSRDDRDTMRAEYDFSGAVRGVTARRYAQGKNTVTVTAGPRKDQDGRCANDDLWSQRLYEFVQGLRDAPRSAALFNPWYDTDGHDIGPEAPEQRRLQLLAYLLARQDASLVFIAEAMGYQGGRFSGIAMTSERMLLGGHEEVLPEHVLPPEFPIQRTSKAKNGWTEQTATIVWRTLCRELDPFGVVLWNSVPWHPHQPGNKLSNRAPAPKELEAGLAHLRNLLALFPLAKVAAVGKKAQTSLAKLNVEAHDLRHPANGGVPEFSQGVRRLVGATDRNDARG